MGHFKMMITIVMITRKFCQCCSAGPRREPNLRNWSEAARRGPRISQIRTSALKMNFQSICPLFIPPLPTFCSVLKDCFHFNIILRVLPPSILTTSVYFPKKSSLLDFKKEKKLTKRNTWVIVKKSNYGERTLWRALVC